MQASKECPRCKNAKPSDEWYFFKSGPQIGQFTSYCKKCTAEKSTENRHKNGSNRPLSEAKDCASYLGYHVAERALSHFFENVTRMPYGNKGFDYICPRGYKIDVKTACILKPGNRHSYGWGFYINKNRVPDWFYLIKSLLVVMQ